MTLDLKQFDKIKVQMSFVPDKTVCSVSMKTSVLKNIMIQDNGSKFIPWHIVQNQFGGFDAVAETYSIYENMLPFEIPMSRYKKFFRDPRTRIVSFIGYFSNIYEANKSLRRAKTQIHECLRNELITAIAVHDELDNFKIQI